MSVCVTSSGIGGVGGGGVGVVGGMSLSHLPSLSSTMMHPLPHQMNTSLLQNNLGIDSQTSTNSDHPNPEMLLAIITRNKTLEGECVYRYIRLMIINYGIPINITLIGGISQ